MNAIPTFKLMKQTICAKANKTERESSICECHINILTDKTNNMAEELKTEKKENLVSMSAVSTFRLTTSWRHMGFILANWRLAMATCWWPRNTWTVCTLKHVTGARGSCNVNKEFVSIFYKCDRYLSLLSFRISEFIVFKIDQSNALTTEPFIFTTCTAVLYSIA